MTFATNLIDTYTHITQNNPIHDHFPTWTADEFYIVSTTNPHLGLKAMVIDRTCDSGGSLFVEPIVSNSATPGVSAVPEVLVVDKTTRKDKSDPDFLLLTTNEYAKAVETAARATLIESGATKDDHADLDPVVGLLLNLSK